MSVNLGSAVGTIELDISKLTAALKTAQTSTKSTMDGIKQASQTAMQGVATAFSGMGDSMQKAGKNMQAVGQSMQDAGGKMTAVGGTLTKNVSLPLVAFGTIAIKAAADFEQGMANVASISGATGSELAMLESKALEMGATTKFSATEATQAFEYMAMAGWDASKMVDGIGGIMALAAADGLDLATTSDIVTDGMTAFGLSADQSGRFADVLAAASSNANTNVSMLGESFKYVAPVAGALGFSVEDTSVALGLMGNAGIKASQAGTSLRGALTSLVNPSDSAKAAMEKYGISITNTDGTMKTLDEIMLELRGTMGGLDEATQAQAASQLFGKNAMSGMLAIINASDEDYASLTDSINNSSGAAERMAGIKMDTFAGSLTLLKSAGEGVAIQIGNVLIPYMQNLVAAIQGAISWFDGLSQSNKELAVGIGLAAAAIGPLLMLVGKLTSGLGLVVGAVGKGVEMFGKMNSAMSVVNLTKYTTSIKALDSATIIQTATMKLAQAAILAKSAITGVLTGQIGFYTAAQWLANAALTAFPVVAVIAGIIAVIAALVKLIMWLTKSSEEFKKQKKEVDDLGVAQDKLTDDVDASGKAFEDNATAIESNARAGQNLVSRLKDISGSTVDAETKSRQMQNVVTQLNGTVDGLNVAYDEQTGKLKNLATGQEVTLDQIEQLTNARAELAQAAAWEERAIELNGELARAQEEQIVIMNKIDDINANQDMSQREKQKLIKELETTYDEYGGTIEDVNGRITIAEQQALDMNTEMAQGVVDGFGQIDEATGMLVPTLEELAAQYGMTEAEIAASADGMGVSLSEWAQSHEENAAKAEAAIADYTDKVANDFEELPTKMEQSAKEITDVLVANAESMANWEQNMAKLSEVAGTEGAAVVEALAGMGTKSSEVVQQLLDDPAQLQEMIKAYATIGEQASSEFSTSLGNIEVEAPPAVEQGTEAALDVVSSKTADFEAKGQENAEGYAQGQGAGMEEAKAVVTAATAEIDTTLGAAATDAAAKGAETGTGFSTTLSTSIAGAPIVAQDASTAISATLDQTTADATAKGQEAGQGYTAGQQAGLDTAVTAVGTAMTGIVGATQVATTDLTTSGQTAGQGFAQGLNAGLQTAVAIVGTAMTGIVGAAQVATQAMTQAGTQAGQGFAQGLNLGLQTAVVAVSIAMTGIVGATKVATTSMTQAGTQAGQGFANGLKAGLTAAVTAVGIAMTGIIGATKVAQAQMTTAGQQAGQGFANGLKAGLTSAVTAVSVATTGMIGAAKVAATNMTSQGQAAGKGFSSGIKSGMSSATTNVQAELNKAKTAATAFANAFKTQGQTAGKGFTTAMKSGLASMITNVQSEFNKAKTAATSFASAMKTSGQQAGNGFSDAFKSGIATLTTNLQAEFNRTKSAISSFSNSATSMMRSAGSSMANAIKSGFSSVGGWESLGAAVAQGIANGISANSGAIAGAARNAAQSALNAAKAALDIQSPSRVMRDKVGAMIPAGIALGIAQATPKMDNAMAQSINSMTAVGLAMTKDGARKVTEETAQSYSILGKLMKEVGFAAGDALGKSTTQAAATSFDGLPVTIQAGVEKARQALATAQISIEARAKAYGASIVSGVSSGLDGLGAATQRKLEDARLALMDYKAESEKTGIETGTLYTGGMDMGLGDLNPNLSSITLDAEGILDKFGKKAETSAGTSGKATAEQIKKALAPLPKDIQKILDEIIAGLTKFGLSGAVKAKEAGTSIAKAAKTGYQSIKDWEAVGLATAHGIARGITAGTPAIASAAMQAAQQALAAAKAALGINSPSRVMQDEVGKWIPLGIAKGFTDYMPQATADMQKSLLEETEKLNTDLEITIMAQVGDTFIDVYDKIKKLVLVSQEGLQDSIQELNETKISGGAISKGRTLQTGLPDPLQPGDKPRTQEQGDTFVFNETGLDPQQVARLVRATKHELELGFA